MLVSSIVMLIIWLLVIGVIWWLVTKYIPLPAPLPIVVNVLFVLIVVLLLLNFMGVVSAGVATFPRLR